MPLVRREHEDVAHGHYMRRDTEREFYVPPDQVQPGDELAEPVSSDQLADLAEVHPDEYDADEGYIGDQFDEDGQAKAEQFIDSTDDQEGTTVPDVSRLDAEEFVDLNADVARAAIEMGRPTDGELEAFLDAELEQERPRQTVVQKVAGELGFSEDDVEVMLGNATEGEGSGDEEDAEGSEE